MDTEHQMSSPGFTASDSGSFPLPASEPGLPDRFQSPLPRHISARSAKLRKRGT
jgi:hypothetical protein